MLSTEFWEKYFKFYDVLARMPTYNNLLNEVICELSISKDDIILDAGSGTGNLSMVISKKGGNVISLDYCKEALAIHRIKDSLSSLMLTDLMRGLPLLRRMALAAEALAAIASRVKMLNLWSR